MFHRTYHFYGHCVHSWDAVVAITVSNRGLASITPTWDGNGPPWCRHKALFAISRDGVASRRTTELERMNFHAVRSMVVIQSNRAKM